MYDKIHYNKKIIIKKNDILIKVIYRFTTIPALLVTQIVKILSAMQETKFRSLGQEDPLEKGMATHSSILAWRVPWTEEPGGLQTMGLQRTGHS